jgi:hypothetical protein
VSRIWLLRLSLPLILGGGALQSVGQIKDVGIPSLCVGPTVESDKTCSAEGGQRAVVPGIDANTHVASATRSPWINANAWRFRRDPSASYVYEDSGRKSVLAIAEAYTYGVKAAVRTSEDSPRAAAMLQFLKSLRHGGPSPVADVSFVDDGSVPAGEVMNLLSRRNILFRRLRPDEPRIGKVIELGSAQFPKALAGNPSEFAYQVRRWLGDENRTIRIYGSENVLAYVTRNDDFTRVHLLNYTANPAEGIRVRVSGSFRNVDLNVFEVPGAKPEDLLSTSQATEFTVASMNEYAAVDLRR